MKRKSLFFLLNFVPFFLLTAFIVTCSVLLMLANADLPESFYRERAPLVFINVIVLSTLFTLIDFIRRKITIERPVKAIVKAGERICKGDFSVRIEENYIGEFGVIAEQFNKMAAELSGIETLRSDFIANVSHELKTPLAIIQNYSTLLSAAEISENKRLECAKGVGLAAQRFSDMITNILKLNKLENQKIFPQFTSYELNEQLCECLLNFEEQLDAKSIETEISLDEIVTISGESELLSLVWNNLFSNAVKFTENGGKIAVDLLTEDEYTVVKISDTGCGMSEETGKHIFEKFYQADISHHTQGNGLGLALVKRVVDIVGGTISVKSELGKGSVFTIKLKRGDIDES